LSDFDIEQYPGLRKPELRDKGGLADIARGMYDTYIKTWAKEASQINSPIFLRVGHEMNDPYRYPWGPQNNSAKDFVGAWRHIHRIFASAGATNIIWIWSPHPSYGWFEAFYPGDKYVDFVGINILNYGTVAIWSKWWTFKEMFGAHYQELSAFRKPMMITEFGSLAIGGDRSKWIKDALTSIPFDYPAVKSVLFFHFSSDMTTTQQAVDWTFKNDPKVLKTIIQAISLWPDAVKPAKPTNPFTPTFSGGN
jgi:beta-mannanase